MAYEYLYADDTTLVEKEIGVFGKKDPRVRRILNKLNKLYPSGFKRRATINFDGTIDIYISETPIGPFITERWDSL